MIGALALLSFVALVSAQNQVYTGYQAPAVQVVYRPAVQLGVVAPAVQVQQTNVQTISALDASRAEIAAVVAQGANPNNFGIQTNAHFTIAQAPNAQVPDVYAALDALRGRQDLTIDEILNILSVAVAGKDYPVYNDIPSTRFTCEGVHQAGFYADAEASCQVIRRCDINGVLWSYLCPNMTLFNQVTLVCDWFFNVNCANSVQFYDYSNPRLYTQFALLDTPAQRVPAVQVQYGVAPAVAVAPGLAYQRPAEVTQRLIL